MTTQVSVRDFRASLSDLFNRARDHHERIVVTNNNKPIAVVLGIDDFESIMETLEILGSPETMAALAQAQQELDGGESVTVEPGTSLRQFLHPMS